MLTQVTDRSNPVAIKDARVLTEAIAMGLNDIDMRAEFGCEIRSIRQSEPEREFGENPVACEVRMENGKRYVIQIWCKD